MCARLYGTNLQLHGVRHLLVVFYVQAFARLRLVRQLQRWYRLAEHQNPKFTRPRGPRRFVKRNFVPLPAPTPLFLAEEAHEVKGSRDQAQERDDLMCRSLEPSISRHWRCRRRLASSSRAWVRMSASKTKASTRGMLIRAIGIPSSAAAHSACGTLVKTATAASRRRVRLPPHSRAFAQRKARNPLGRSYASTRIPIAAMCHSMISSVSPRRRIRSVRWAVRRERAWTTPMFAATVVSSTRPN